MDRQTFIAAFLFCVFGSGIADTDAQEAPTAVAGVPASFPPQYQLDALGNPSGFAVDAIEAIAATAGINLEFEVFDDWTGALNALEDGRIDLIPDLGISPQRQAYTDFTAPIETFAVTFFVREEARLDSSVDLVGRRVGVIASSVAVRILAERDDMEVRTFDSPAEAVRELLAGRLDAIAYPSSVMWNILRELRIDALVKELQPPLVEVKRAVGINKQRPDLLERLEPATDAFVQSPEYEAVYAKWFGRPRPFWTAQRVALVALVMIAFVVLSLAVWRYVSIRRLVAKLTAESEERRHAEEQLRELTRQLEQRVYNRTEELRQSERRQRMILEHLSAGVVVHAPDTTIVYCNEVAQRLLGLPLQDALGKGADDPQWQLVSPDERPMPLAHYPVMRVLNSGKALHDLILGLIPGNAKDSSTVTWLLLSGVPIINDQGQLTEVVITFVDITEQRRLADQNYQMERFDALGRLTAGVAHELNNPLMGIVNGVQYCLSPEAKRAVQTQVLQDIERHTKRCIGIVDSLLTFSRSGASFQHPFVDSDVETLVGHVVRLLEYRIRKEGVELRVESAEDMPKARLQAEPFQQLVINLLTNAMDAVAEASAKTVTLTLTTDADALVLRVADRGVGIPHAEQARIFDPFFTTKPAGQGTGLGLSTCWSIVQDHGGQLECKSRPGEGTTFTVRLPLTPDETQTHPHTTQPAQSANR
jgi:signal transduction histidine kinase